VIARGHPLYVDLDGIETGDPELGLRDAFAALKHIYRTLDDRLEHKPSNRTISTKAERGKPLESSAMDEIAAEPCHDSSGRTRSKWLFTQALIERRDGHGWCK
jgi:hypothetical protein